VRKSRKHGRLKTKYFRKLNKLGFVWEPRKQFREEMLAALRDYRRRFGDCDVPQDWPENRRLARWVVRMRRARTRNVLTEDEIGELDRLRFEWHKAPSERRHTWDERYAELAAFKKQHGHCKVPWNEPLAQWATSVRQRRRQGKVPKDKIRLLSDLGFRWKSTRGGKQRRKPK
jgi:hypothetical protein